MIHHLKIEPTFFADWLFAKKTCELRRNDRDFHAGDDLVLQEYGIRGPDDPAGNWTYTPGYTGREIRVHVRSVLLKHEGLHPDFCLMSCERLKDGAA